MTKPRVGVAGATCTGKTTLVSGLASALDVPILEESARVVAGMGFPIDKESTLESQTAIVLHQVQLCHEQRDTGYIADRVFLDCAVYMSTFPENRRSATHDKYVDLIVKAMGGLMGDHFDVVFYLPIEFPVVADGFRETDPNYQKQLDELLRSTFQKCRVDFVEISGSKSERLEKALSVVSDSVRI